jgi:hypothetical protein
MLRLASEHGVALQVMISPAHASECQVFDTVLGDDVLHSWKRQLVAVHAAVAHELGRAPVPLWDFSCANAATTEAVPTAGDVDYLMHGYWDLSHYRAELGTRALNQVYGAADPSFGVRLLPDTVDAVLAEQRARQHAFAQDHIALLEDLGLRGAGRAP